MTDNKEFSVFGNGNHHGTVSAENPAEAVYQAFVECGLAEPKSVASSYFLDSRVREFPLNEFDVYGGAFDSEESAKEAGAGHYTFDVENGDDAAA